ncbi:MAG TPA: GAF domain-containing protein, partial [Chloroflexi bacterium]|nr:GAF domain-containing protein [Chloroflexota bacterium]
AEVAREAAAIRDVGELLDRVVHLISDRFGFYHAGVFLVDDLREYAVLRAASSEGGRRMLARGHRLKVGETGIVGWVAGTGQPRIALAVGEDAVFFDNPDLPLTRSEMALPLKVRGEVIGVLDVQSEEPAAFGEEDVAVLQAMADQIALAIENARLLEESQRALRELESLYGRQAREAWIEQVTHRPLAYRYAGLNVEPAVTSEQLVAEEGGGEDEYRLSVPIRLRGETIGTILLRREPEAGPWSQEEVALAEEIGVQIGLALENARLLEETKQRAFREQALSEITAHLTRSLDMETLLRTAVQGLVRMPGVAEAAVHIGVPDDGLGGGDKAQS